jgi:hypothetical protein
MPIDMSGVSASVPLDHNVYDVDLADTPVVVGPHGGADLVVQGAVPALPATQNAEASGALAANARDEFVALPRSVDAPPGDEPGAFELRPQPDRPGPVVSSSSGTGGATSKYSYRYVYSYRYSAVTGSMVRVLRPVLRPRLAGSMASARMSRSSPSSVRGSRRLVSPELRQAHIDRVTAERDGMQQLRTASVSNYERSVDARVLGDAMKVSPEGDGAADASVD